MKNSHITRRSFLKGACASAGAVLGSSCFVWAGSNVAQTTRKFSITFKQKVQFETANVINLWSPLAMPHSFQIPRNLNVAGNYTTYAIDNANNTPLLHAIWNNHDSKTKDLQISFDITTHFTKNSIAMSNFSYPQVSDRYIRTDGEIGRIAHLVTNHSDSDLQKAYNIFTWIAHNITSDEGRNIQGIRSIKQKNGEVIMRGEDISATSVFVAMCRAVGIPAVESFGLKLDSGRYETKQLHKPELYTRSIIKIKDTWIPNDVILAINLLNQKSPIDSKTAIQTSFNEWDNNWILFNFTRDIRLKDNSQTLLSTMQNVYGEIDGTKLSSYDSLHFQGSIIA